MIAHAGRPIIMLRQSSGESLLHKEKRLERNITSTATYYLQDPSVLEFQRRFQDELRTNNLNSTFGVARIPADSQFRDLLDSHDYEPLLGCFGDWIGRMQDAKWLQHYQFLDGRYLITMDGSQYFSSYQVTVSAV